MTPTRDHEPNLPTFGQRERGHDYRLRPAAYAVVLDGAHRVACVREESGLFLPGGGIEPGEDPAGAVVREVAEECGCALEILASLGQVVQYFRTGRGEAFELRPTFFFARFGPRIASIAQLELLWLPATPQVPPLYHECHRWAVAQAIRHSSPATS